jgi:hypothetical protein
MDKQLNVIQVKIDSYLSMTSARLCSHYWKIFANESKKKENEEVRVQLELLRDITSFCFNFDELTQDVRIVGVVIQARFNL